MDGTCLSNAWPKVAEFRFQLGLLELVGLLSVRLEPMLECASSFGFPLPSLVAFKKVSACCDVSVGLRAVSIVSSIMANFVPSILRLQHSHLLVVTRLFAWLEQIS
jgi:hypothetical protein